MTSQMIHPYEFIFVKKQVANLVNAYRSVNDSSIIQTLQGLTRENVEMVLNDESQFSHIIDQFMDQKLTKTNAEKILNELKEFVIPFKQPSEKQLIKSFKKVKKFKQPNWPEYDLRDFNYFGWNDKGTQRKYMVLYHNEQLVGFSGILSPNTHKGACAICNEISNVSLFLTTTKFSGDGTYTKKGNYICHDSVRCNQQMSDLKFLTNFINIINH
ncbi:FusB/FusC family EF-G-binding protein [Sporosarcina sp. NPDC096371]|uniref:FusB/FusC family EF-G-binding protein n=1 Tax=Sporosarcina sp. NPDC096371 TaxID=3364530 RepID=UPI00380B6A0C